MKRVRWLFLALAGLSNYPGVVFAEQDAITVMSFNIRYGTADDGQDSWQYRRNLVTRTIQEHDSDLLGLQEALAFQVAELEEALDGYGKVGVGRDDGVAAGEFSAVMYRKSRFELLDQGTFWFSDTPEVPGSTSWGNQVTRICTWVHLLDRTTGQGLYLYNVHWDHESQESRERSAALLVSRIDSRPFAGDPVIVTGDFNAGELNPAFRYLIGHGLDDTFRAVHPAADSVGTFNGFAGVTTGEKIDAVLVSDDWHVSDAAIIRHHEAGRYPSDHFPVFARIVLDSVK